MILTQTYGAINQDVQQFGLRMWSWSGPAGAAAVEYFQVSIDLPARGNRIGLPDRGNRIDIPLRPTRIDLVKR